MYFAKFKIFILLFVGVKAYNDLPCAQGYTDDSVVCVCNATYCDTITREQLLPGQYMSYTSSRSGLRFSKTSGVILDPKHVLGNVFDMVLLLQTERMYQTIEGFGGAVTDSAAMNWKSLPPAVRRQLVKTYFGEHGIEYNMIRVPNGSTDFSTRPWAYNSEPANDTAFTNFTLSYEDKNYKIPFIKEILNTSTHVVEIVTSTWSPPDWMLEVNSPTNMKSVKQEFYQAYADYHCKFAELYKKQGINIWGMAAVNEPMTAVHAGILNETTFWTGPGMAIFLGENFGPTIRKCSVENIKILGVDDQRMDLPFLLNTIDFYNPNIHKYLDGIALHFYTDTFTSPAVIARSMSSYPDKFVIVTEGCVGTYGENAHKVVPGSWDRAKMYIRDVLENLNYNVVGWIDWNVCLNEEGGPTWTGNFVDAPIIVDAAREEFFKQPIYYAFGQFSKFLPRGSKRMRTVKKFPAPDPYLDIQDIEAMGQEYFDNVAFLTPHGTAVTIIHNDSGNEAERGVEFLYSQCNPFRIRQKVRSGVSFYEVPFAYYATYEIQSEGPTKEGYATIKRESYNCGAGSRIYYHDRIYRMKFIF